MEEGEAQMMNAMTISVLSLCLAHVAVAYATKAHCRSGTWNPCSWTTLLLLYTHVGTAVFSGFILGMTTALVLRSMVSSSVLATVFGFGFLGLSALGLRTVPVFPNSS